MNDACQTAFEQYKKQIIEREFSRINSMQLQAVTAVNGPLLILAGAGSGKTTVLVNRIANLIKYGNAYHAKSTLIADEEDIQLLKAYLNGDTQIEKKVAALICERPVSPYEVLAITFTNKAAGELKERIEQMIGPLARDVWAGTFHSTCARILRRFGERLGYSNRFTIYDTDDSRRAMKECQRLLDIDEKVLPHRAILNEISRAKDMLRSASEYAGETGSDYRLKKIADAYILYEKTLKNADAMDFDDLIFNTIRLFEKEPDVLDYYQDKFKYIMVDEYQDTNHAQYMLVKLLAEKHRNICVVGDDDQSIYRFRGATIENILNFEKEYPDALVIRLEQNYRSTSTILDAANAVIANNRGRKGKTLWTQNGTGKKVRLISAPDEQGEARFVADRILEIVREGRKYADNAVLYRMNAQSNALENVFVRSGIPYKIVGGFKFYDRKEIKDVLAYLSVINNPSDNLRLRRIINEPKRGIGETTISRAVEIAEGLGIPLYDVIAGADEYEPLERAAGKLMRFAGILKELTEIAQETSIHKLLEMTLDKTGYMASLSQGEKSAERIENVNELSSSILQYEQENEEATLSGFLEEVSLVTDIDDYDPNADKVVLMTLHAAKGLEFPNVFLVGMEEGIFPGNQAVYAGESEVEEERRLAYVGITRAKEQLFILHCARRMLFGQTSRNQISRFVSEIPPELIKEDKPAIQTGFSRVGYTAADNISAFVQTGTPTLRIYSQGDLVRHKTFGAGEVVSATPMGNDTLLVIQFECGIKKLMANFAKLDKA